MSIYSKELQTSRPLDSTPEAARTADIVNELNRQITAVLSEHPINIQRKKDGKNLANIITLRGPGIQIDVCTLHY